MVQGPTGAIAVEVGRRLATLADINERTGLRFAEQLALRMHATWRRLGISAQAPPDIYPVLVDEVVRVRLNGRLHRCPEIVARATSDHFMRDEPGAPVGVSNWPEELASCLTGEDSVRASAAVDAVAAIAYQIVDAFASELISREYAARFLDAVDASQAALLTPARLATVLRTAVSLGAAISDAPRVMEIISEAGGRALADVDLGEIIAARLRKRRIRIEANPEYFERIIRFLLEDAVAVHDSGMPADLREGFTKMAEGLFYDLGVRIPEIEIAPMEDLSGHQIRITVGDAAPSLRIGLAPHRLLVAELPEALIKRGITADATANPANGRVCAIIAETDRDATQRQTWDPAEYLVLATAAELRRSAHLLVDLNVVERELAALDAAFPALVIAALDRFTVGHLARVLRLLLREDVRVRNLRAILEILLADNLVYMERRHDPISDAEHAAAAVRAAMSQYLSHKYAPSRTLNVYLLDPVLERELETLVDRKRRSSDVSETDIEVQRERIRAVVNAALPPPSQEAQVILTRADIRFGLSHMMAEQRPDLAVLASEEVAPGVQTSTLGTVSLTELSDPIKSDIALGG